MHTDNRDAAGPPLKTPPRYVQVTSRDRPGFVEFRFAIGDPELYLEMILPDRAFAEFCRFNQAVLLPEEPPAAAEPAGAAVERR